MPAARRHPNLEDLVEDLFLRLRWISPTRHVGSRSYPRCGLADEPVLLAYFREARVWWLSNELAALEGESRRWLIYEIYQREPGEAALVALALFGTVPFPELRVEDIDVMATWFEGPEPPARNIRDALVLKVWLPWFVAQPASIVDERIHDWLRSDPCLVRAALVLSVGFVNESSGRHLGSTRRVFETLTSVFGRCEREVGSAVGWFVASVWSHEPQLAERWLTSNAHRLSRKVFRIAAGRMPSPVRVRLMSKWKSEKFASSREQS